MKILIVVGAALLCGIVGFVGTMEVARRVQNASSPAESPRTGDIDRDMMEATKQFNQAAGDMAARQNYSMIGGAAGAVVGLFAGIAIAKRTARRNA